MRNRCIEAVRRRFKSDDAFYFLQISLAHSPHRLQECAAAPAESDKDDVASLRVGPRSGEASLAILRNSDDRHSLRRERRRCTGARVARGGPVRSANTSEENRHATGVCGSGKGKRNNEFRNEQDAGTPKEECSSCCHTDTRNRSTRSQRSVPRKPMAGEEGSATIARNGSHTRQH